MPTRAQLVTRTETTSTNTENLNKGSKLSFAEMDSNFLELRDQTLGIADDSSTVIDIAAGNTLTVAGANGIQTSVSGQTLTIDGSQLSSIGDLTVIGSEIIAPSNADLTFTTNGTGNVVIDTDLQLPAIEIHDNNIKATRTNDDLVLETNNTGSIILRGNIQAGDNAASGLNNTTITGGNNQSVALIGGSTGGTVKVMPGPGNGTGEEGDVIIEPADSEYAWTFIGNPNQNLSYVASRNSQDLILRTGDENQASGNIQIADGSNANISITPHGTGATLIGTTDTGGYTQIQNAFTFRSDSLGGTQNQLEIVLTNDGSSTRTVELKVDNNNDPFLSIPSTSTSAGQGTKITSGSGNLILQSANRIELSAPTIELGNNTIVVSGNRMFTDASNEDLEFDANGTGNVSSLAQLNMNSNKIINVTDPASAQDAATKAYVDAQIGTATTLTTDGLTITDNNITGTRSNEDINVTASGTGQIVLNNNTTVDGTMTATQFEGDLNGAILLQARNQSGGTIYKGQAVYVNGLSGDTPTIILADASDPAKMPALGVAKADINNNATDEIVTLGNLYAIDTSASNQVETGVTLAVGDVLYISATQPGKLTNVAPAGESNQIQNIGRVVRVSPNTNMTFKIHGAGRSNATPALDDGNIFIGNASNQTTTTSLQTEVESYSINNVVEDTTPELGGDLDVNGNSIVSASGGNIAITPDTTGNIILDGLTFPNADGTADQVLGTNGSGVLSFRDPTAINIDGGVADSVYTSTPSIDGGDAT